MRHLLSLVDLDTDALQGLLDHAQAFADGSAAPPAAGRVLASVFFEASTRTRVSFALAADRLGWQVVHLDAADSSFSKGESVEDTIRTLAAMGISAVCLRHADEGAAHRAAGAAGDAVAIVNAGGGKRDHPTQGLLDALTIRQEKSRFEELQIAICGDVKHSRVARSDIQAFTALGARGIRLVGPQALLPDEAPEHCELVHDLETGISDADVIIALRIQMERLKGTEAPDRVAYYRDWGLTQQALQRARPDCIVLHPGPMNRGVEIADGVADGPHSRVLRQVTNGVYVRMAVLEALTAGRPPR